MARCVSQISVRVVLDPAGLREVLRELALRQRDYPSFGIEQQRARARGALVERENVLVAALTAAVHGSSAGQAARLQARGAVDGVDGAHVADRVIAAGQRLQRGP